MVYSNAENWDLFQFGPGLLTSDSMGSSSQCVITLYKKKLVSYSACLKKQYRIPFRKIESPPLSIKPCA